MSERDLMPTARPANEIVAYLSGNDTVEWHAVSLALKQLPFPTETVSFTQ